MAEVNMLAKARSEDDAEIQTLLARYCVALDLDDVALWVSLFTVDASCQVYGRSFEGHEGSRG
jgi:hypothetical protein